MKNRRRISLYLAIAFLGAFIFWTMAVLFIDVQPIGPRSSRVGFAALNSFIHGRIGVHMALYNITDWLGFVPIAFALLFAICGLIQWIRRRNLFKVDPDILILGVFYFIVITTYIFFEIFTVNFRPVLINDYLEISYPSSTTMLASCILPTTAMQIDRRIKNKTIRGLTILAISLLTSFMVIGRLISGVHWFSDIIGGLLFSVAMVLMYH